MGDTINKKLVRTTFPPKRTCLLLHKLIFLNINLKGHSYKKDDKLERQDLLFTKQETLKQMHKIMGDINTYHLTFREVYLKVKS